MLHAEAASTSETSATLPSATRRNHPRTELTTITQTIQVVLSGLKSISLQLWKCMIVGNAADKNIRHVSAVCFTN